MIDFVVSPKKPLKLAFWFPGQAGKDALNVRSFIADKRLESIVNGAYNAFKEAVKPESAAHVFNGDPKVIRYDTQVAQLRSYLDSMIMWLALMNHSPAKGTPTFGALTAEGYIQWQVSGHSLGSYTAANILTPGNHLDDSMNEFMLRVNRVSKRGELMNATPHNDEDGGIVAISGLPSWQVDRLVWKVNHYFHNKFNIPEVMEHVNYNAPNVHVVAGPLEALRYLQPLVAARRGKVWGGPEPELKDFGLSPFRFHQKSTMRAVAQLLGLYLSREENQVTFPEQLTYVSGVTGEVIPHDKIDQDAARGVTEPVRFYTWFGPSIHGAAHKRGFYDAITLSPEIKGSMRTSRLVAPHLMTDYESLQKTGQWILMAMRGEVPLGKATTVQPAPSPQLSHSTPYLARS